MSPYPPAAPKARRKNFSGYFRALLKQLKAALAHFRVFFLQDQFDAVVKRTHRAQHVMAQPRTQQAGKIERIGGH
jgi:uncharacterized protein YdcH (DUF465 family)